YPAELYSSQHSRPSTRPRSFNPRRRAVSREEASDSGDARFKYPITGIAGCCARAASGHAAAAPPSTASNSRRPMVTVIRPSRARCVKGTIPRYERAVFTFKEGRIAVASPLSHCPKQTFGLRLQSTNSEDRPFYSIILSSQHPRFAERDFMEYQADGSRSLQFDPRKLDHLGPFLSIRG